MNTNSDKHDFIDRDDSYNNSANNNCNNNIIANKRWKRKKRRNKNKINHKNSKCDNNSRQINSMHSESESTKLEKVNYSDNEESNENGNSDKSIMNDNDSAEKNVSNIINKNYTYSETLYDVAEMDPWKDDRCRDFIALNVIQRLRSYHLPRNVTEMPPFAPINALRARNLIILPRVIPDYRPCMGETPIWETSLEKENSSNNNSPSEKVCNCSTELLETHKEKLASSPTSSFPCVTNENENEAFTKSTLPSLELHNANLSSNNLETEISKCLNDNFNNLENDCTHNQVNVSDESIKKENRANDNADQANNTERDNIELYPPPPLLPCLEFSTSLTREKTANIPNESICAIERARVLFYGPNGPLVTSTSPVASSGNKMTASSLSRLAESTSLSRSYRLSERFANTSKHDVSQLSEEMEMLATTQTEIKDKDECIKLPETSIVVNEHESPGGISKTEPHIPNAEHKIISTTTNESTLSEVEDKTDNEWTESRETIKSIEEERLIKQEQFEEEEQENNLERKDEELVRVVTENAEVENINVSTNKDDEGGDDYKTDAVNIKESDANAKEEEDDEDKMLTHNSCSQTEVKSTPQRISSMTNVETAEVSIPLFCTPMPINPEHGNYSEQNNKVMMISSNNTYNDNNNGNIETNEFEVRESVKSNNDKYNNDSNETSPLPRIQKSAIYSHSMIETTSTDMDDHNNVDSASCAACDVLIDYFQSLLTRGVVLDRFSHKDLGFAWWVLGKDMNTNSLPQSALSRSPSSRLSTHASRRSKSNTNNNHNNHNSDISMSAKRERSTTSQTHSAPSFPVGREKLLIMHRNLYYTLLTNESTRAKQIQQMHSATEDKNIKNKLKQEIEDVNDTTLTNNKERLQIEPVEQKINVNESKKIINSNNLRSDKFKLTRQAKEKAKKQSLQSLKRVQRTAKRTRYIVEEVTVESSSSSSSTSSEEEEEEQEKLTDRSEQELESQEQVEIDDEEKQQRQELYELDDKERQPNLLLSKRQTRKHMTKDAKLAAAKSNKNKKMKTRRDNWQKKESNNNFLTAVELNDEGIWNKAKKEELYLSQDTQSQENIVPLTEEERTINRLNEEKAVVDEEFEADDVNNNEECQSESSKIEEVHEEDVATNVKHENNQGRKWKRRRSSWFDKTRRVTSNEAVRQKRRRVNAVATDESSHDKSETVDVTTKANATMEKLEVLEGRDMNDQEQEFDEQQEEHIRRKENLTSRRLEKKYKKEELEAEQEEEEQEQEQELEKLEIENLANKKSKIYSEGTKKRVARRHNDETNVKINVRAETSKPSSSPSASYTAEGVIDSADISPYEAWLNEHMTKSTILKLVREHHISRYNNMNHNDINHNFLEHKYTQQLENNVSNVYSDTDHYSIAEKEHEVSLVSYNDVIKCNTAERINKRLHNSSTPYSFLLASECQNRKRGDFLSLLCASAENTHEDINEHLEREEEVEDTVHDMQHHAVSSNMNDKSVDLELLHSMKRYEQWEAEHLLMEECKTEHGAKEVTNNTKNIDENISKSEVKEIIDDVKNVSVKESVKNDNSLYKDAEIKDHLPFSELPFAQKCLLIWHCSNCLDTYARRRAERDAEWKEAHHKRGVRTRGMILRSHSGKAEKPNVITENDNATSSHKEETSTVPIDEADETLESTENEMPDELILESSLDEDEEDEEELEEEEEEEWEEESKDSLEIEQKLSTEVMDKTVANTKNVCKEELLFMAKNMSLINPSQQTFANVVLVKDANSVVPTSKLLQSIPEFDYWKEVNEKETQVKKEKPTQTEHETFSEQESNHMEAEIYKGTVEQPDLFAYRYFIDN